MNSDYLNLIKSGLLAVLAGYAFRYIWPMVALLSWQTVFGPVVRVMGGKLPEDSRAFFYAPKAGEPLAIHWFHPNHQLAVPILFTVGVCFGYVILSAGDQGYDAVTWLLPGVAAFMFGYRGFQWVVYDKDPGIATRLESVFFLTSGILEFVLILNAVWHSGTA
jgi:hypothetical protein